MPKAREAGGLERFLRIFADVRAGEGPTALLLLLVVFLVLTSYYFVKPLREGWLAITEIRGLSKIQIKAYSSFGQSVLLIGIAPFLGWLASASGSTESSMRSAPPSGMACRALNTTLSSACSSWSGWP